MRILIFILLLFSFPCEAATLLGTSTSATNPQISGDATSGIYTAGAGKIDLSSGGTQIGEFNLNGILIYGTVPTTASTETWADNTACSNALPGSSISGAITSCQKIINSITGNGSNVSGGDDLALYVVNQTSNTGTLPYMKGIESNTFNNGTGTVTLARPYYSNITNGGGGTISALILYGGGIVQNNGTIGTLEHFGCDSPVGGQNAPSTEYCLYNNNANANNFNAGTDTAAAFIPTGSTPPASDGLYQSGGDTAAIGSNSRPVMKFNSSGNSNDDGFYIQTGTGATPPAINIQALSGSDTNVSLNLNMEGTGTLNINNNGSSNNIATIGSNGITGPNGALTSVQSIGFSFGITPGFAIPTGTSPARTFPQGGVITAAYISGALSGGTCSAVVDIWMIQSGYPTVTNTITASDLPTLTSANYHKDTSLTGWTTTVPTDATFIANIQSTTCDNLTVTLEIAQ